MEQEDTTVSETTAVHVLIECDEDNTIRGVYSTPEAAMNAKPGEWKWVQPRSFLGHEEPGYWDGVTENEPGWHKGRGHFVIERHEIQSRSRCTPARTR